MRYIESVANLPPKEKKKDSKKVKPVPKTGTKDYDYANLAHARKIPTKEGFQ